MEKSASIPIQSPKQHFPILSSPTIFPIQNCQTPKLSTTDFLARPVDKKPSSLNTLSLLSLGIRSADSSPNSSATLSSGGSESPVSIVEMERPAKGWNLTSEFSNVCLEFGNVVR